MKYLSFSLLFALVFSINSCGNKDETSTLCSETLTTGCARCCDEVYYSKFCTGDNYIRVYKKTNLTKVVHEYNTEKYPNFNSDSFVVFYKRHGNAQATCQKF